uniref:Putative ATPase domain containing protein n=1 Tax=viral metagenome TaxID=1070528 RepID=A0A6H1ZPD4_9ZZZZ
MAAKSKKNKGFTHAQLMNTKLPDINFVIRNVLPEGLSVLAGMPKARKSFLALNFAIAVSTGCLALDYEVTSKGRVLHLSLEDGAKRLKNRSSVMSPVNQIENLHFFTQWRRLDEGGLKDLEEWVLDYPDTKLIIIDTLTKIWPMHAKRTEGTTLYHSDYDVGDSLKQLADLYGLAIMHVYHLNKQTSVDDPIKEIQGSLGMSAAPDTILMLKRPRESDIGTLFITGRDIEEERFETIEFDRKRLWWHLIEGAKGLGAVSDAQVEIIKVMRSYGKPMKLRELANIIQKSPQAVSRLIKSIMKNEGLIERAKYGEYSIKDDL